MLLAASCSGGSGASLPTATPEPAPTATPEPEATGATPPSSEDPFPLIGRPQARSGIGDVEGAFARYEASRAELIALFRAQPWFQDGLTREESLFVERSLSFVARYGDDRSKFLGDETVRRRLYLYERVRLSRGEVELMLIYEPGQPAERELAFLEAALPAVEKLVGVEYPEKVMVVINGAFNTNDFNEGQFIRIARASVLTPYVLAHELSHTYWSSAVAPSWFIEGMADVYSELVQDALAENPPAGWRGLEGDLDALYRRRKSIVDSGRFRDLPLPRRFASDGLYDASVVFLLDIRRLIGGDAFVRAATDIYLASDFGRRVLREKRLEDVFLLSTPPEARDAVMALFNRMVWGDTGQRYRELQELEEP